MSEAPGSGAAPAPSPRAAKLAITVAALGYFVDIYDLILFGVVGRKSLADMGVAKEQIEPMFQHLLDVQMLGMLVGGILWGVLGDRRGRLSVLFGSILMYSLANIANGMLTTTDYYAELRFVAGIGLAGELGAGITLVAEIMHKTSRGWGTTVIAGIGVTGAIAAALVDRVAHWTTAYYLGGVMGLLLLGLRIGVRESGMFKTIKETKVSRGNFFQLFSSRDRATRYLCLILSGVPVWYLIGILVNRAPKIAKDMGLDAAVVPGTAVMMAYIGLAIGDVASGVVSQLLGSRRKAVALFLALSAAGTGFYFTFAGQNLNMLYGACLAVGIGGGYWAVFVTMASEQFGTNLRSTVTTTAPNFVRGSLVLVSLGFAKLEPSLGPAKSAMALGVITIGVALLALLPLGETFGKSLEFVEE